MKTKTVEKAEIEILQTELSDASAEEIIAAAAKRVEGLVFATSLGREDQVILDLIAKAGLDIPVFTLDTGRLFPETYELVVASEQKYGLKIQMAFPDTYEVENMVDKEGINLFRNSIEARKRCCAVRKLHPLRRRLAGCGGWICGLRRGQSSTRADLHAVEWDVANGIPKFNPLVDWMLDDVQRYLRENRIPYNPLHDRGFASIGCACCTRAIGPGEDIRAGRWWWEAAERKECGLHVVDGNNAVSKDLN